MIGLSLGVLLVLIDFLITLYRIPGWPFSYFIVLILLIVIGIFWGKNAPHWLKVWATTTFFFWGALAVTAGRSSGVFLTIENLKSALLMFFYLTPICLIPIFRLWNSGTRIKLILLLPVFSFTVGLSAATLEERIFVKIYSGGIGPTPRWLTNIAWMSYTPGAEGEFGYLRGGF